jgi:VWFA-related protein
MRPASQVLTALVCGFSFAAFAQQGSAPQTPPPPQTTPAEGATAPARGGLGRRVSIDVVVTDKSGKPVAGLQQQDFTLLDDKQPQAILSFSATDFASSETTKPADPPMQAILLVDAVNAGFQGVGVQRLQLEKFLRQDGGRLPIPMSLVLLTDTSAELQRVPTRDGNALADSLNSQQPGMRISGRSQGFYGAEDRLQISLRALQHLISFEATQPGRKLLVWLSPGWSLLSGPGVQLTAKNQEFLFNTIVELSRALREARITLYSVDAAGVTDAGSFRTFYYETFLKGVSSANKVQNGDLGLQVLAAQSGGRVLNSSNNVASSIATCVADANAFYTLSFDAPPADHPNEYHSLQIKIDKPGLTARTRTGYYAQR